MRRRALLRAAAAAGVAGIAGCTSTGPDDGGAGGGGGGGGSSPTDSPTGSPTDSPTDSPDPTTGPTRTEPPEEPPEGTPVDSPEESPTGSPDGTPTRTPQHAFQSQSFEVTDRGCGGGGDSVEIDFEAGAVSLDGTIGGSDACYTAEQESAVYDAANDRLSVNVRAYRPDKDRACADCIVDIEYAARYEFDGDGPAEVAVSHDGREIARGGQDSASASPSG